jgi:hypothetical protein
LLFSYWNKYCKLILVGRFVFRPVYFRSAEICPAKRHQIIIRTHPDLPMRSATLVARQHDITNFVFIWNFVKYQQRKRS